MDQGDYPEAALLLLAWAAQHLHLARRALVRPAEPEAAGERADLAPATAGEPAPQVTLSEPATLAAPATGDAGFSLDGLGDADRAALEWVLRHPEPRELLSLSPREQRLKLRTLARAVHNLARLLEGEARPRRRRGLWRHAAALLLLGVLGALLIGLSWGLGQLESGDSAVNLALGRPVKVSSSDSKRVSSSKLVDGDAGTLGCHTRNEHEPWVRIDLGAEVEVRRVVVRGREAYTARAVPLRIELGSGTKDAVLFAEQTAPFKVWEAQGNPKKTRYVRVRATKKTVLQLHEVEVY